MKRFIVMLLLVTWCLPLGSALAAESITCWFAPGWKSMDQANAIADALSKGTGADVKPRIATSYPEILDAFASKNLNLVYAGSFVQSVIVARKLGTPLAQNADGKELYAGIMVYKAGEPKEILVGDPDKIAYAIGASSGESSAKAATNGKASMGVASHGAAVEAVISGKAKAAVVKDSWWASNKEKYAGFKAYEIPGVSEKKNPDNVLTASSEVPAAMAEKIKAAAISGSAAFGQGANMKTFSNSQLNFSLGLMMKGKIDPLSYKW